MCITSLHWVIYKVSYVICINILWLCNILLIFLIYFQRYEIFGDVFEEAVTLGLPAVQIQHPGFYYQQAADYAVLRRNTVKEITGNKVGFNF